MAVSNFIDSESVSIIHAVRTFSSSFLENQDLVSEWIINKLLPDRLMHLEPSGPFYVIEGVGLMARKTLLHARAFLS